MDDQKFYVVGGEFADTNFSVLAPGTSLERYGPFTEREAKIRWRELTGKTVDNAMVRYFLKASEQSNKKIYWVVGGEYADTTFTSLVRGKELEVFGPFEKWEALGFWRGLTSKTVDDALVRYDIRENYDQEKSIRESHKAPWIKSNSKTVVKSIIIERRAADVSAFLIETDNWSRWAIHSVRSAQPGIGEYKEIETPNGRGHMKVSGDAANGIFDTATISALGKKQLVPGRVFGAGEKAIVVRVFTMPLNMPDQQFEQEMDMVEEEFLTLKKILE